MKFRLLIIPIVLFLFSCGSKKNFSQSETKEKVTVDYTDNSKAKSDIRLDKQLINTNTNERIITMYGVKFDTIYTEGRRVINPISFLVEKEEERDINSERLLYKLQLKDSIENAISSKFKGKLELKDKEITELKETRVCYQLSVLIISIAGIILLVLYFISRAKLKRFSL